MYNHDENVKIYQSEKIGLQGSDANYILTQISTEEGNILVRDNIGRESLINAELFSNDGILKVDWDTKKLLIDGLNQS